MAPLTREYAEHTPQFCPKIKILPGFKECQSLNRVVGAGARAINKRLTESTSQLKEDAVGAIKISLFVLVTLLGALYVLDF